MRWVPIVLALALAGCSSAPAAPDRAPTSTPTPPSAPVATPPTARTPPPAREVREVLIDPGQFAEVNFRMRASASIAFAFNVSAPVVWDVHSHPNGTLAEWRKGRAAAMNGTFVAPTDDIYSVLLEWDSGPSARGNVTVEGDFTLYP